MINTRNCANAAALTGAIFYTACALFVALVPGAYIWVLDSWSHGMNLTLLEDPGKVLNFGLTVAGLVTFSVFAWLSGALFASLYNGLQGGSPWRE